MPASEGRFARPVALLFVSMDTDHDLVVTGQELAAGIRAEWARADKNHNDVISGFEIADWDKAVLGDPEAMPDRLSLDVDLDGSISFAEFEAGLKSAFANLDANRDGRLDREELLVSPSARQREAGGSTDDEARPSGEGRRGGRGGDHRRPY